ncbi:hypothetical protein BD626DRAFT_511595 [Schizophyllum amplum]|uniref:Uncharacterized protein n=1 Tax=Schizophyllum amplum TaxID=97359 RepID=A0A550C0M7_9AGAR|nr:hypothetical protein BD626DRAFT_511595 [Auriculariopsis ampla]
MCFLDHVCMVLTERRVLGGYVVCWEDGGWVVVRDVWVGGDWLRTSIFIHTRYVSSFHCLAVVGGTLVGGTVFVESMASRFSRRCRPVHRRRSASSSSSSSTYLSSSSPLPRPRRRRSLTGPRRRRSLPRPRRPPLPSLIPRRRLIFLFFLTSS